MKATLLRFVRDDSGATAVEYGLIAGLIAVVTISAIKSVGLKLTNSFLNIGNKL
jgi:pilus assembly protein Flp/PilA